MKKPAAVGRRSTFGWPWSSWHRMSPFILFSVPLFFCVEKSFGFSPFLKVGDTLVVIRMGGEGFEEFGIA